MLSYVREFREDRPRRTRSHRGPEESGSWDWGRGVGVHGDSAPASRDEESHGGWCDRAVRQEHFGW